MRTFIISSLLFIGTLNAATASTYRWVRGYCQEMGTDGMAIQDNVDPSVCREQLGSIYLWNRGYCQEVGSDWMTIRENVDVSVCREKLGTTYIWNRGYCQEMGTDGMMVRKDVDVSVCREKLGTTYIWNQGDCNEVGIDGGVVQRSVNKDLCHQATNYVQSLNSCSKALPSIALFFPSTGNLTEVANLLNNSCASNQADAFSKCYVNYHFVYAGNNTLGATEKESVEFCRQTENHMGVAQCFNKLKTIGFTTASSFKYCSENYSPEFVSCAQRLTKNKIHNLLKVSDETLLICNSRALVENQYSCLSSLVEKNVEPYEAFAACAHSKDPYYTSCLANSIRFKGQFKQSVQTCQTSAQSSAYIGIETLPEDLNKLAKVSYPALAKIYRKQSEYLNKYKFSTANWNAENDIYAFTLISLSPFIEYNTSSYNKNEVIPSYMRAKKVAASHGYSILSDVRKSNELTRFALQSLAMGLQAIRLTLSEPAEIKHCEQTLVLIGNALANLNTSSVREVTLQVDKIVKINPLQTQPLGIFTSSINEFLKN